MNECICGKPVSTPHPDYGDVCPECAARWDAAEEDMRRHEENEAAAILDSMHRYGWCYE